MTNINDFEARLEKHPNLYEPINRLFDIVENAAGDANRADDAEDQVSDVLRQLGQRALVNWAEHCEAQATTERKRECSMRRDKKNSVGIVVTEPLSLRSKVSV